MSSGIVFDIKKFSIHDGPGIRTTVFLKGCGLRCWWCHNPESQHPRPELMLRPELCIRCGACVVACPQEAIALVDDRFVTDRERCTRCGACTGVCHADAREIVGREMSVHEVIAEVMRDVAFYDESGGGVTFSGGEPLMQAAFLLELLQACKAHDLHTAVDTCGHAPTEAFARIRPYTDLFLYDLKLIDAARHRRYTGVSNELILQNLRQLSGDGSRIILRVPVVPGVNDDADNLQQIGAFASALAGIEQIDILAYHRIGTDKYARLDRVDPMPATTPPTESRMDEVKRALERSGLPVKIGG